MPAINFQKRFAKAVESGRKCQTIRAPRIDGRPHAVIGSIVHTGAVMQKLPGLQGQREKKKTTGTPGVVDTENIELMLPPTATWVHEVDPEPMPLIV